MSARYIIHESQKKRNGTENFQWTKGFSDAANNLTKSEHTPMYLQGYQSGQFHRFATDDGPQAPLPDNTTDHYMHYYIGFDDGRVFGDKDYDHGRPNENCTAGHDQEYCLGYRHGYDYEYWIQD